MHTNLMLLLRVSSMLTPLSLLTHFLFNFLFVFMIARLFYYRKSKRIDYLFTFLLISSSLFLIVYLLSGLKLKTGFALGLFAVFGIMKYRTVSIPVREMTYLFVLVAISVINALCTNLGWTILFIANVLLFLLVFISEVGFKKRIGIKYIKYDRIDLCKKSKLQDMIADIEKRFELKVVTVHIGNINCLKDMALIKVYYELESDEFQDDEITKVQDE